MSRKNILFKGIRILSMALPLLFMGPVVIHSSFKNQQHPFFEVVLGVGILVCLGAIGLIFWGISLIVKTIFND